MYKLQGHSLTRGPWFLPESQSLTLMEKGSTSTITMPMDSAVQIDFNDWLYDEDVPGGDPIVWRVKSISESNNTNTVTIELEHVIKLLEDQQIFGEVTTEDISGGTSCTARQAIEYLLSGNFDWQLGALEVNNSLPYEFETLSVYDAIESVTDTLEGVYWEYDLTQHPFVLNVRLLEMDPDCEMREGRNLSTLKRSVSRTGMYTRIYPIGENDLHIPGDYISNNEEIYGRIDKVVTDSTKTTIENLGAWAHGLLMHNSDPDVTITISGLELSESTGEPMDRLRLNRFCRCPLPEYATTIIERITKLVWKDLIKDRESVTVTLANNMKELSEIIKSESNKASGGSGAAGQAKQNYLFQANGEHLLYEVFDENGHLHGVLRMTSESLRVAFENLNECTRSEFRMTSESLRISFENEIRSTRSEFQMTSESLRIQFENDIASTRSEFEMTSASLRVEFTNDIASARSEFQMTAQSLRVSFENSIASTRSLVEQTDRAWRASVEGVADSDGKITAASIGVAINAAGDSEAWIDASHIWIGNEKATTVIAGKLNASDVTAEYLAAKIANIPTLRGIAASFSGNVSTTSGVIAYQVYADGNNISNPVMETRVSAPVNNVYTLQHKTADGTWHDAGTFSRATTLSGAWSGATFTVTASPQGDTKATTITLSGGTGSVSNPDYTASSFVSHKAYVNVNGSQTSGTATVKKILFDATSEYDAGVSAGGTAAGLSLDTTNHKVTRSTSSSTKEYTVSVDTGASWSNGSKNVYAKLGNTNMATGSVSIPNPTAWSASYIGMQQNDPKMSVSVTIGGTSKTGTVSASGAYNAGVTAGNTAGYNSAKMSGSWNGATYTVTKNTTGSASVTVTLGASISYNSSTHKYTANANAGGSSRASATSGTEAYDAGKTAGQNSISDFGIWKGDDDVSGDTLYISPSGSVTLKEWHKKDGSWVGGSSVTVSGNASFYGNTTLYYKNLGNNQYYSAGSHNWYYN